MLVFIGTMVALLVVLVPTGAAEPSPPPAPAAVMEQSGFVGEVQPTVEPLALADLTLTAFLALLTAGSVFLTIRFRLLRGRPAADARFDALAHAARPQPGAQPLNIGLMLLLASMGVWAVSVMMASIPYTLAATGDQPPASSIALVATMSAVMAGTTMAIVALAWTLWAPVGRMLGLPTGFGELVSDLKAGLIALALALPVVLFAAAGVGLIIALLAGAGLIDPPDPLAHQTLRDLVSAQRDGAWWTLVAVVVLAVPLAEEILYRGLLQTGLRTSLGVAPERRTPRLDWLAVVPASVVFTLVHTGIADAHSLVVLIVLSVALGIAYERTGRLLVPVVLHAGFNGFNILVSQFL